MFDRRKFLKILCLAGVSQLPLERMLSGDARKDSNKKCSEGSVAEEKIDVIADQSNNRCNIIFCEFNNPKLRSAIEQCASEMGCRIEDGRPGDPDILAFPYFISIVDRNIVGKDTWESYLAYRTEVDEIIPGIEVMEVPPCIVIDKIKHKERLDNIFYYDIRKSSSVPKIINMIRNSFYVR